jgi:hypothetical protein
MTRTRIALTLTTLGLAGLLGLSGCGAGAGSTPAAAAPAPSASTANKADKAGQHPGARKLLRKNTLHGEITVQGKQGVRTIVVQRGTVTAVDAKSMSVKSADGFTKTWTLGDKLRVVQDKKKVEPTAIKPGAEVGVVGTTAAATLVKIR